MRYGTGIIRCVQAAVFVAAGLGARAMAQAPPATPADAGYINVLPHYVDVDANRRGTTDDGHGIAVGYGHPLAGKWSWEFQLFEDVLAVEPSFVSDFHRYGAGFDLNYRFRRDGVTPFVVLGVGAARNEVLPSTLNDTDYFGNAALGILTGGLGKSEIRLRAEVRYIRDRFEILDEGEKNDRRLGIGVQIPLGRRVQERVVEREVPREVVREVQVPAQIVDSDNDGVPDQNDRCPGTLQGLATDSRGCAATSSQSSVRLEGVTFELNSATLTADASTILLRVADALRGEPNLRAEIAGHTDSSGADAYNLRLSQERADAVLQFLVRQGIERNRLVARGYGETQPVADNSTPAGRERNRRVEFNVLN
ncbi:MAG TPA: OmpA family protein [Gammaproteobacteria bacterium]|nr:OmpA family protein [Gammaproteobacteria bacterium]